MRPDERNAAPDSEAEASNSQTDPSSVPSIPDTQKVKFKESTQDVSKSLFREFFPN